MPRPDAAIPALIPAALAALTTLVCLRAAGATAGLFFGGFAFAALTAPPFAAAERTLRGRLLVGAAVTAGTALVWLVALRDPFVTIRHWLVATTVLATFVGAAAGAAAALRAARLPASLAAAATVLLLLLWLTWPVWLSPHAAGRERLVAALAVAHPLLALDDSLAPLGPPWTERTLMYNELTVLNQDVAYARPTTVLWSVLLHGAVGAAGLWAAARSKRPDERAVVTPIS
jgi:hypothetical protein